MDRYAEPGTRGALCDVDQTNQTSVGYPLLVRTTSCGITDWEAELKRVALHIAAAEQRIEHQRKKIDRLSSDGCAISEAEKTT